MLEQRGCVGVSVEFDHDLECVSEFSDLALTNADIEKIAGLPEAEFDRRVRLLLQMARLALIQD